MDWIPLDLAAKAVIDFRAAGATSSTTIAHLVHPRPTSWTLLAKAFATELSVPLVPFSEWLQKLEQSGKNKTNNHVEVEDMRRIPALRLLQFFRSMSSKVGDSGTALGFPRLSCENAVQLSSTLSKPAIHQLGEKDVKKWLEYWRSVGFIRA